MSELNIEALRARVYARMAALADVPADQIGPHTSLESAGLDSSDAVILAMEVEEFTRTEIDVGIFLRFETLDQALEELARIITPTAAA